MELIEKNQGKNQSQYYTIKMWWDAQPKEYVIRYTWCSYTRKYTRTKRIKESKAALYYYSYSTHICRQHIALEEHPLHSLFNGNRLPSAACLSPRTAVRNNSNAPTSTPAQRNQQRRILIKLINK